jgi:hypothetical protein
MPWTSINDGSVHEYNGNQAQLILRNQYPTTSLDIPTAIVCIESVLENVQHHLLEVGSWINVIGNVRDVFVSDRPAAHTARSDHQLARAATGGSIFIDATMIWSAGAVKPDKYNKAVRAYQLPLQSG